MHPVSVTAIVEAGKAGLVAFGLCVPILALRTEQNMENQLVLQPRWNYVAIAVAGAVLLRFLYLIRPQPWSTGQRARSLAGHEGATRAFAIGGLALLVAYPFLSILFAGKAGAIKWIDNFGIQVLIYVMLGWGLNIVVGLAGLLDLGYVAFYAVGAYSYALLAANDLSRSSWRS